MSGEGGGGGGVKATPTPSPLPCHSHLPGILELQGECPLIESLCLAKNQELVSTLGHSNSIISFWSTPPQL